MKRRKLFKVAVLVEGRSEYDRAVLRGIRECTFEDKHWIIRMELPGRNSAEFVSRWKPDGILMQATELNSDVRNDMLRFAPSVVNLSDWQINPRVPCVGLDNKTIGKMAAEYFLHRRFVSFAFVGVPGKVFSTNRQESFEAAAKSAGYECRSVIFKGHSSRGYGKHEEKTFAAWLKKLPDGTGLFASNDECAFTVSMICGEIGIVVPDKIAILGVDNDELICELAFPRLSSIAVPAKRVGHEAVTLLDSMMQNPRKKHDSLLLPPSGIITRQSTDISHTEDDVVNRALRFIQLGVERRINVDDVLCEVNVCRRLLERRFAKALGRSPFEEIKRVRMEQARALLVETEMTLDEIAARCGYANASQFILAFRKEAGNTPSVYRRRVWSCSTF